MKPISGNRGRRIAVCVPARDIVDTGFAFDLARMVAHHTANYPKDKILLFASRGTILPSQRRDLAKTALDAEADWILWVDTDQRFPKDMIERLLRRNVPVLGCNVSRRKFPLGPTARKFEGDELVPVFTDPASSFGLEEVDYVGMGVMLTEASVFHEIEKPWFAIPWSKDGEVFIGEDIFFCDRIKQIGVQVLIDHDLSKEIGHVGQIEFRHEHVMDAWNGTNELHDTQNVDSGLAESG